MLLKRGGRPRAGVTLIELLVVISIIIVLMGLLLSGVMRALGAGPKAETTARIAAINNAIGTFKSLETFGKVNYIPAGQIDIDPTSPTYGRVVGPFRLRNSYTGMENSFEAQYLQQVFGGGRALNWGDLGMGNSSWGTDLDANQTLTFFLTGIPTPPDANGNVAFTGFSTNPQKPFTPRATADEARRANGPILDLGGKRKYLVDSKGFARMIDAYTTPGGMPGTPFVYFVAYNGKANKNYGGYNPGAPTIPPGTPVLPYSRAGQYENPSGFQIISAGKDGVFGSTGNWAAVGDAGKDDQANFSNSLLGSGPQ